MVSGLSGLFLLGSVTTQAQRPPGKVVPAGWQAFVQALDSYARTDSVVGASAMIMQDGKVIAHHERGLADRARREPVDERTIYH